MSAFDATSRDRVKDWLGNAEKGSKPDELLDRIIPSVTHWIETHLRVKLDRAAREAFPRPNRKGFTRFLDTGWGAIDTDETFAVRYAADRDFASATDIEATAYYVHADAGFVELDSPLAGAKPGTVRLKGTGGLADKLEFESGDTGLTYLATSGANRGSYDSIVMAATIIAGETWKRRKTVGRKGARDRSGTIEYTAELAIPKHVKELLQPHRRRRLGS